MLRNYWMPAVPTDVSVRLSIFDYWLSVKASLDSQQTMTGRVRTFLRKSPMTELRKEKPMLSD